MATELTIRIAQGATFSQALSVGEAFDGRTVRATWRAHFGGPVLATFSGTTVAAGATTISLTAAQTAAVATPPWSLPDEREIRYGVYDVELVDGASVERSHQGHVLFSREATT